jgi:hypothetical protein
VLALVVIVVVLSVFGLVFYAMHRSKPSRLKLTASFLKLASFSIEVESKDVWQGAEGPSSLRDSPSGELRGWLNWKRVVRTPSARSFRHWFRSLDGM